MPVFFVHSQMIQENTLTIQGPLHSHLTKSLRYRSGDHLWCGDAQRQRYYIRITSISSNSLVATILDRQSGPPTPLLSLTLGLAILKGDHMNWAIQKATELGVQTIVPLLTQRGVVRPSGSRAHAYQERWQRIAVDAAQQSERWDYPCIQLPCEFAAFLGVHPQESLAFILMERGSSNANSHLSLHKDSYGSLKLVSGPEGGWSEEEKKEAEKNNFQALTLGPTIFRAETAPLVALSLIQYQLGGLG
jgi:16S rRNA (uracil1498-N3)-methyltransferase